MDLQKKFYNSECLFDRSCYPPQIFNPKIAPIETDLVTSSAAVSHRASFRRMKWRLATPGMICLEAKNRTLSPSERFMHAHCLQRINEVLRQYGATTKDIALFKNMIGQEGDGFLGYQAGSSTVRLFQDMILMLVKDILKIPVKDDFVFTRIPGDPTFKYDSAGEFLKDQGVDFWDGYPYIRQHLLSLNMNLYQSFDAPWDLTPRYFLENTTWTYANVREIIKPFFSMLGIDGNTVDGVWSQALDLLSHDRGYILQFFDCSEGYAFTKKHAYIAYSGGKPYLQYPNHEILFDDSVTDFPQIRVVVSNESALNPFSSLSIKRYDSMTNEERQSYESSLRSLLKNLDFDPAKVERIRDALLKLWRKKDH